MKVSHRWLQTFFEDALPDARTCADVFTFHAFEVEGVEDVQGDSIIDVDVLPNRSSDCLSHRGIARELSTILDRQMKRDPLTDPLPSYERPDHLVIGVEDAALCPRYMGAVIRDVTVGPSPDWLREALEALGQRSINNIVDATNYVMLELGQPLHAFDYNKLTSGDNSKKSIGVRSAREGETITLLGGEERTLTPANLLITDATADTPIAIAGVKGGAAAEITDDTTDIVLESANFHPVSVRRTSQAVKLVTDASVRFQNEPAVELAGFAMRDVIAFVQSVTGGTCAGVHDTWQGSRERMPIDVSLQHINALLGTTLTQQEVESILVRFGWEFSFDGTAFAVTPPWERTDLTTVPAIIEEVGRIYGLRSITSRPPTPHGTPRVSKTHYVSDHIRAFLCARGYSEVLTYVLRPEGEIELENPLASDKAFLRRTLRDGLGDALAHNASQAPLLGLSDVRIFECGTRFTRSGEELSLAVGVRGIGTKQAKLEQQLMNDVQALEHDLGVALSGSMENGIYEANLGKAIKELDTPEAYAPPLPWNSAMRFTPWSLYPFVLRDIAVWVPSGIPAEEVLAVIIAEAPALLVRHDQFDTFEKDGRVSYAWHLVFQASDRTLTDFEVTEIMNAIVSKLHAHSGWEVR